MPAKKRAAAKSEKKDLSKSYNQLKQFGGRAYTGMAVGRTHSWIYQKGSWKERKVTPDKWTFDYTSTKRRKGKAPKGSGAPVGTEYHWYILAHQRVRKLDENTYDTHMEGEKFKLAHKRSTAEEWSTWSATLRSTSQKRKLLGILEEYAADLKQQIEAEELEKEQAKRKVEVKAVPKEERPGEPAKEPTEAEPKPRAAKARRGR